MTIRNTTHQQRIAKALNDACGCGYQEALRRVQEAAVAGWLPARLDAEGRAHAVRILARTPSALRKAVVSGLMGSALRYGVAEAPAARGAVPWSVAALVPLAPGTVTALVSLPTAGRSTLALNIALHHALQGTCTLFTSGEISFSILQQKVLAARYGVDVRREEPAEGWAAFRATVMPEAQALPCSSTGRASAAPPATASSPA
ncbi:hypothetical protein ACWGI0_25950 [Streptomyces sp. NPDC054802]